MEGIIEVAPHARGRVRIAGRAPTLQSLRYHFSFTATSSCKFLRKVLVNNYNKDAIRDRIFKHFEIRRQPHGRVKHHVSDKCKEMSNLTKGQSKTWTRPIPSPSPILTIRTPMLSPKPCRSSQGYRSTHLQHNPLSSALQVADGVKDRPMTTCECVLVVPVRRGPAVLVKAVFVAKLSF
jgi:hypothetical protein